MCSCPGLLYCFCTVNLFESLDAARLFPTTWNGLYLPLLLPCTDTHICVYEREILYMCTHTLCTYIRISPFTWLLLFSCSVGSDSLQPHGLQHARVPYSLPSPRICSNSCPLSQWCHPTISFSVILFSCLQSFPASGFFSSELALRIRWPKYWSFSFSISPSNEYSGLISFSIDWFDFLGVQRTLKSLLQHHSSKASILQCSAFFIFQLSHLYMTTKTIALTIHTFVDKVISLLFNILCRFVIVFLPRSKCLLISWFHSSPTVIFEPKKIKSVTVSIASPSICREVMGPHAMILVFWMLSFKPEFSLSSFTFIKRLFSSSSLSAIRVVSSAYLTLLTFLPAILIPAYAASSPAFCMMYSAYKLNKLGDNIQPWCTLFPIWNQSIFPCLVLTIASWLAYRFLRRQIR